MPGDKALHSTAILAGSAIASVRVINAITD
jgi:hypothetical protein